MPVSRGFQSATLIFEVVVKAPYFIAITGLCTEEKIRVEEPIEERFIGHRYLLYDSAVVAAVKNKLETEVLDFSVLFKIGIAAAYALAGVFVTVVVVRQLGDFCASAAIHNLVKASQITSISLVVRFSWTGMEIMWRAAASVTGNGRPNLRNAGITCVGVS